MLAPKYSTIQEVLELIRVQHGLMGRIKESTGGADIDQDDPFEDWLGKTNGIWDIVTILETSKPASIQKPNESISPAGTPPETDTGESSPQMPMSEDEEEEEEEEEKSDVAQTTVSNASENPTTTNPTQPSLEDWITRKDQPRAPKPPTQGKNRKKVVLTEISGGGEGSDGARRAAQERGREHGGGEQAEPMKHDLVEQQREFSREVSSQEGVDIMTERIEEVLERCQQHVCRVGLAKDDCILIDTTAPMYEQERWIVQATEDPTHAFRLTRCKIDKWATPLVAGYTYELIGGNGPRVIAKFIWNDVETEVAIWPERPLLNRDMILTLVHPQSTEHDWAVFDTERNHVEMKDLGEGPNRVIKDTATIHVMQGRDRATFIPGGNLEEQIRKRFELEMDWWILRSATEAVPVDKVVPGTEYRIEAGRLNYFEWHERRIPII
jgi:hypothetical protein